jgi:ribosomal protein L29
MSRKHNQKRDLIRDIEDLQERIAELRGKSTEKDLRMLHRLEDELVSLQFMLKHGDFDYYE